MTTKDVSFSLEPGAERSLRQMAPPDAHVQLHIGIVALSEGCCFLLYWYEQIYDFVREASLAPDHERSLFDEDADVQGCQLQIVPSHAWGYSDPNSSHKFEDPQKALGFCGIRLDLSPRRKLGEHGYGGRTALAQSWGGHCPSIRCSNEIEQIYFVVRDRASCRLRVAGRAKPMPSPPCMVTRPHRGGASQRNSGARHLGERGCQKPRSDSPFAARVSNS